MTYFRKTTIAMGAAQLVMSLSAAAQQTDPGKDAPVVVVTGQRAALQNAQKIKQDADEIVDSIVADDIGKLPDRSVTEVLQRIPGVTIDRTMNRMDPQQGVGDGILHFAAEGTGVSVRGMSYVRSELNGRDSFSANGGRALSFEDVPPELMAGVDVYKNPSAEQIEGAIGGLVNLRTALPFDNKGRRVAFSLDASYGEARGKTKPSYSGLVSDRWDTSLGQFGVLLDVAHSEFASRGDGMMVSPYYPLTNVAGDTSGARRWISPGASWGTNTFERERDGLYGALQWKKGPLSSALTFFKSTYEMKTDNFGFFMATNPAALTVDPGATFDDKGALLTGVLRAPSEPGVGFGTDARYTTRHAQTRDTAWTLAWRVSDRWTLKSDLQYTKAGTTGMDNTVGLGGYMPKETVNLGVSPAIYTFDESDRAHLADPKNYYWGFAQEHRDNADASQKAARLDARYDFDDPILQDLRFGVRFTDRESQTRSTHSSEWQMITQPWAAGNSWQPLSQLAYLSDPRFAGDVHLHSFDDFFNGKLPAPASVIVPDASTVLTTEKFAKLHSYTQMVCKTPCNQAPWKPAPYGDDRGQNEQHERTKAIYGQLRFNFNDLPYPVDGNIGVRVVRTDMRAVGYTLFTPPQASKIVGVPVIAPMSEKQSFNNTYTNTLPSLNVRMKPSDELQFRLALSKGITRPDFYSMQAYTTLGMKINSHQDANNPDNPPILDSIEYTGSARGNTFLKPIRSNNLDLTAEYYFGRSSSVTMALFAKKLEDIIIGRTTFYRLNDAAGQPHDFLITAPSNDAEGWLNGIELGYQQYFDKYLPDWAKGFGLSANYTYINSGFDFGTPKGEWCTPKGTLDTRLIRDLAGCDTDGRVFGNMPLTGMSKNAFNVALLYDHGKLSGRIAYSWRSRYLQAVNAYGTNGGDGIDANPASPNKGQQYSVDYALPTWGGAYGQVDAGLFYKINDHMTLGLQANNLTDRVYRQYVQQQIGLKERSAFSSGRSYHAQLRYTF
jgi:TonB-dependent receptor